MRPAFPHLTRLGWIGAAWTAAAGICAFAASIFVQPGWPGIVGGGLAVAMIAIAAIDARCFIIPDKLVLAGLVLGLVNAVIVQPHDFAVSLANAALRGLILALLFFGFRAAYRRIRGRDGLGLGDVKLAAVAGVWLGWTAVALAVDIAALAALAAVLLGALAGRKFTGTTPVPFGLFFAPAIWVGWLIEALLLHGAL